MVDTYSYMIAGFVVILGSLLAYVASLILRYQRLKREARRMEREEKSG